MTLEICDCIAQLIVYGTGTGTGTGAGTGNSTRVATVPWRVALFGHVTLRYPHDLV